MEFTITFSWWWIPAAITVATCSWALFIHDDGGGYMSGLGNVLLLVPALLVSALAGAVAGFLK